MLHGKRFASYNSCYPTHIEDHCSNLRTVKDSFFDEEPDDWRLFIDSSMRSLKAVLLHNTNKYAPIPIAHSVTLKEDYRNIEIVLDKIKYVEHKWQFVVILRFSL